MAEAQLELQIGSLGRNAVSSADEFERLLIAGRHTDHHVGDQRAAQPMKGARAALIVGAGDGEHAVLQGDLDGLSNVEAQRTLGAGDADELAVDCRRDSRWERDRQTSDT